MRLVLQRVSQASVKVDNAVVGQIDHGILALLGVHRTDTAKVIPWMVGKLLGLRIFTDDEGKMNRSVIDIGGQVLVISQFTLYGDCTTGRRPSFTEPASPEQAIPLYEEFLQQVDQAYPGTQSGEFGAKMQVSLVNEGPVTFVIDSK